MLVIGYDEQSLREREAMNAYLESKDRPEEERIALWARFIEIHAQRNPEAVKRMERARGLG